MGGKRYGGSDFFKMIARDVFLLFFFRFGYDIPFSGQTTARIDRV